MYKRYSVKESLQRILLVLTGKPSTDDTPETLSGDSFSEDESFSQIAELLQESLPGETLHFPNMRIGNSSSYVSIGSNAIEFVGDATVFDDIRVPLSSVRVGASSPPDFGVVLGGLSSYLFSPTADEQVYFAVQMPHGRKPGTNIYPHVHFMPTTAGTGTVRWGLEYSWADLNEVFGTPVIIYTSKEVNELDNEHILSGFGGITGSSNTGLSSMLICRLFRDADHADDTYPDDAALLEIDFHYEISTIGSADQYS